jgi:hypothetical protein
MPSKLPLGSKVLVSPLFVSNCTFYLQIIVDDDKNCQSYGILIIRRYIMKIKSNLYNSVYDVTHLKHFCLVLLTV